MSFFPQDPVYTDIFRLPISSTNLEKAICMLDGVKEQSSADYYYFMGTLLMNYNFLDEAKCYFLDALVVTKDPNPIYFQLYKIDVREKNYSDAFLDIFHYQQNCDRPCDFSFALTMLEMYNDLEYFKETFSSTDYEVTPSTLLGTITIVDPEVKRQYFQAIEAFNQLDFPKLKENLENLKHFKIEKPLRFEIKTLITFATALEEKYEIRIQKLPSGYSKKNTIKESFLLIESMISSDIELAKGFLLEIEQKREHQDYSTVISYLHGRIREEELYQAFDLEKKSQYNEYIQKGKIAYKKRKFDQAYEWYLTGKKETGHPIFDYYIGKTLYKKGSLDESIMLLKSYRQQAGAKFIRSTTFLYYGYYQTKQWKELREEVRTMDQFNIIFETAFTREKKSFRKMNHKNDPESIEQEAYSSIRMTEEDFSDTSICPVGKNKVLYKQKRKYGQ